MDWPLSLTVCSFPPADLRSRKALVQCYVDDYKKHSKGYTDPSNNLAPQPKN